MARKKFWIDFLYVFAVEAYTASWIEIQKAKRRQVIKEVEAYTASWIEMEQWRCTMVHGLVEAYTASWIEI